MLVGLRLTSGYVQLIMVEELQQDCTQSYRTDIIVRLCAYLQDVPPPQDQPTTSLITRVTLPKRLNIYFILLYNFA